MARVSGRAVSQLEHCKALSSARPRYLKHRSPSEPLPPSKSRRSTTSEAAKQVMPLRCSSLATSPPTPKPTTVPPPSIAESAASRAFAESRRATRSKMYTTSPTASWSSATAFRAPSTSGDHSASTPKIRGGREPSRAENVSSADTESTTMTLTAAPSCKNGPTAAARRAPVPRRCAFWRDCRSCRGAMSAGARISTETQLTSNCLRRPSCTHLR
mmetsp:Transcript_25545/g.85826  ORF Transcript_25545/g.85826 Transcript_25545/m.85826 type:complete len:215 (+) Transcript_25545:655-1299(+)